MHPLWFYKHQHDNRVRSELSVACQRWWFQWRFWFIPSVPGYLREEEEHKPDPWPNPIEINHMGIASGVYRAWPRQSFWITLYINIKSRNHPFITQQSSLVLRKRYYRMTLKYMAHINVGHELAPGRTKCLIPSFTSLKTEMYCSQAEIPSPVSWTTRE